MQKKKTDNSEALYGELGEAFNFTQGDLEANRAGFISYRQKQAQWTYLRGAVIAVVAILIAFFILGTIVQLFESDAAQGRGFFWSLVIAGVFFAVLYFFAFLPNVHDILSGRVESIVKRVRLEKYQRRYTQKVILVAGEERFELPRVVHDFAWQDNIDYQIYFLPRSRAIVAIAEDTKAKD